jgi:hypothetical protein
VYGLRVQRRAAALHSDGMWSFDGRAREAHASGSGADDREAAAALDAERAAWSTGTPARFPDGWAASPWLLARERLLRHDVDGARTILIQSLTAPSRAWALPSGASSDELAALVALVPEDAPVECLHGAWALQAILHEVGLLRRSAEYGALAHARHGTPELAHQVARSLAQLGDEEGAVAWLREAQATATDVTMLDADAELDSLRDVDGFQALREEILARAGSTR